MLSEVILHIYYLYFIQFLYQNRTFELKLNSDIHDGSVSCN